MHSFTNATPCGGACRPSMLSRNGNPNKCLRGAQKKPLRACIVCVCAFGRAHRTWACDPEVILIQLLPFARMLKSAASAAFRLAERAGADTAVIGATQRSYSSLGAFSFSSTQDGPTASSSSSIKVSANTKAGETSVTVSAGAANATAKYPAASSRAQGAAGTDLKDVARVSVLHSSFVDYLLKLSAERYAVLAQWPDFTTAYGKDFYYRAHPQDLKAFYQAADSFHTAYDAITEFDSLSLLASELLPGYSKRHHNVLGPAVGPTTANAAVARFFLNKA